jgi:O-antigen/teichoic acid export membrane protein
MVPMIPVLTATVARDRGAFVNQVRSACGIALGVGACGMIAGVMLAPDLVTLLYRGRYLEGALSCVNAFRWLAVALGLVCVTTVLTASMLADGKEKLLLTLGTIALIANIVLNVVLLRHYNFTAAGFATAVTELLFLLSALIAFRVVTGRSAITGSSLPYLFPGLAMVAILYLAHGGAALRVTVGVALGLLSLGVILVSPQARRFRREMAAQSLLFSAEAASASQVGA